MNSAVLILSTLLWATEEPEAPVVTDAYELHARAMEAELDGDRQAAIQLLRQAAERAPDDELIFFDLARLLSEDESPEGRGELDAFLRSEPDSLDARLLQVYLHLETGSLDKARLRARQAAAAFPDSVEANDLNTRLAPSVRATAPAPAAKNRAPRIAARVLGGSQYDSNVLVVPDQRASDVDAFRALVDGEVLLRLLQGEKNVQLRGGVNVGPHLTDDDTITAFDVFAGRAGLSAFGANDKIAWSAGARTDTLYIDRDALDLFLFSGTVDTSVRYLFGRLKLGAAIRGSVRDFSQGNVEDSVNDRDGFRTEATAIATYATSRWAVFGRAGYQGEHTDGVQQTENGSIAGVSGRWYLGSLSVDLGLNHEFRSYVAKQLDRVDHRVTASLGLRVPLNDVLALTASAAWIENISSIDPSEGFVVSLSDASASELSPADVEDSFDFDYTRQLVSLGVEARW
ncbi:MAG: tetratricopeptide repeat protein [Myxococcota bacterium]